MMIKESLHPRALVAIVGLAAAACGRETTAGGVVCTENFVMITVSVRDTAGAPVNDAAITRTITRTGEQVVPGTLALMAPGNYVLLDDGAVTRIRHGGEEVRVTGASTRGSFAADYVFDVPSGCHVRKVSGPDSVTVR